MDSEFEAFERFPAAENAAALVALLEQHQIEFRLEENRRGFDPTFAHNPLITDVVVKVRRRDFAKVYQLLEENARHQTADLQESHYFQQFNTDELLDVLRKPEEWSKNDVTLARKMLEERGVNISEEEISRMKEAHRKEIVKPVAGNRVWIITGFLLAILGGWIAIALGWNYYANTKTDLSGQKHPTYDAATRRKGLLMMMVGALCLVAWWLFRLFGLFPFSR
jgi:lipopolysaccharide export system protein LptC